MLILACPSVVKNRLMFSVRGASILGFSIFGANRIYALTDEMKLVTSDIKTYPKPQLPGCYDIRILDS